MCLRLDTWRRIACGLSQLSLKLENGSRPSFGVSGRIFGLLRVHEVLPEDGEHQALDPVGQDSRLEASAEQPWFKKQENLCGQEWAYRFNNGAIKKSSKL